MLQLLTYGLKNGNLIHISEVANGLACGCICTHCKQTLVAKNNLNNKKEAHFAHYSTKECEGALETTLHLLAKEVLLKTKSLFLPDYHYDYNPNNEWSIYNEGRIVVFDEILLEKSIEVAGKQIITDAIGIIKDKQILIEFANSHFVDEDKKRKIENSNLPCVEINLTEQILDEKSIFKFLNSKSSFIYWVINPRFDSIYKQEKEREKEEMRILQLESEKARMENLQKLEKYKLNKNIRVLVVNKGIIVCPEKINKLKQTQFYQIPLLKRIIDGEFWNGVIYKNYSTESIYINDEKIELSSQEEWIGLKRMQFEIPDWECVGNDYSIIGRLSYKEFCFKCNYLAEILNVNYKRYVICNYYC